MTGWRHRESSGGVRVASLEFMVMVVALTVLWTPSSAGVAIGQSSALSPLALVANGEPAVPPFGVGERLVFDVKYGFVSAGTAVMSIPEMVSYRGHACYHILSVAESNAFISAFFPVRDVAESLLDAREMVSRRFEKRLREGDFRAHDLVVFDHDRHIAIYPKKGRVVPLALNAQDILSSLYYVRMMKLEVGSPVSIENHADKKNYPLEIKVLRRERVEVPAGEFDCIVVEPVMRTGGLFSQKGRLWVWLTDDDVHMPVLMKSKIAIGSISVVLKSYERAEHIR
ncbi:DUF3108 domain-containing protein [bacterium]|nr:DUF3108 domain-containing protein [bacterium]